MEARRRLPTLGQANTGRERVAEDTSGDVRSTRGAVARYATLDEVTWGRRFL